MKRFCLLIVLLALTAAPARAADPNLQNYRRAFSFIDSGRAAEAANFLHGRDPILNKVLRSYYMAQPGNDISFEETTAFIADNPDWPNLRGITAMAERKIPVGMPPPDVVNWFVVHPPVTVTGFYRYIDALQQTGQDQAVPELIRNRWINGDFNIDELATFHATYATLIDDDALHRRLDRMLWKNDILGARLLYTYLDPGYRALGEARLALAAHASNAAKLVERVPPALQDDTGLLYAKLHDYVRTNDDDRALAILDQAPDDLVRPDVWWDERQTLARRMIDRRQYESAYQLAVNHGPVDSRRLADAEFLAGWLALRYLGEPGDAVRHFEALYDGATTPISRARGAYWLGRAYEAEGNPDQSMQAYKIAALLDNTYYGQLATAHIYTNPVIQAAPEPAISAAERNAYYEHDLVRASERLAAIGETDRAHSFFLAAANAATTGAEFAMLSELAYRIGRPDFAVEAAKVANKKNIQMTAGGFPVLARAVPRPADPAFIHALIRQESMFNPDAHSPVGAEGLMQLMPATAKGVARKLGMKFKPAMLREPDYNLRIGTAFAEDQIDSFNGSYVLALAGYNAGPHRVREWMAQIGDPRRPDVDVVDWVEKIPVYETRNYVQRIIESLQVYRARLAGGQAPLQIEYDLKR